MQKSGLNYRTTYAMEKARADVFVFGDSQASHHYVPVVFEEELEKTFYNAGRDGTSIFYHDALLGQILERHTPERIILGLSASEMNWNQQDYDRLSVLLPYVDNHKDLLEYVELRSTHEFLKMYSRIYPFNSLALTILKYIFIKENDFSGYIPFAGVLEEEAINRRKKAFTAKHRIDPNKIESLTKFIQKTKGGGVELFVVISPGFNGSGSANLRYEESVEVIREVCAANDVVFWNLIAFDGISEDRRLFSDMSHLNHDGAKRFSRNVSKRMKGE